MSVSLPTKIGFGLAGLLALGDVATPLLTDGEHPPMVVALLAAVLGVATFAAILPSWRRTPAALWTAIATRAVSALGALPAFLVDDVPSGAKVAAAVGLVLTVLCIGLLAPGLRARQTQNA